jgi:hypothetical protein
MVVGIVFWTYPPKKINEFYGYRTTRSRKSQEAWDFAQKWGNLGPETKNSILKFELSTRTLPCSSSPLTFT